MPAFETMTAHFRTAPDTFIALTPGSDAACVAEDYLAHYGLAPLADSSHRLEAGLIQAGAFTLWCQLWTPPAPVGTAVVVHGYLDHQGLYAHLLVHLLANGWRVLLWDLPGHGLSSGARAAIEDFTDYEHCLDAVRARLSRHLEAAAEHSGPWLGVGQSTGAGVLASHALHGSGLDWAGLVLLAPLVRPCGWPQTRWLHRLVLPFTETLPRRYRANSSNPDFLHFLRHQDPLQNDSVSLVWVSAMRRWMPRLQEAPPSLVATLVLQGEQDTTVDWRYNLGVLVKRFPRAEIYRHPSAGHHLVNETAEIREPLFERIRAFARTLVT